MLLREIKGAELRVSAEQFVELLRCRNRFDLIWTLQLNPTMTPTGPPDFPDLAEEEALIRLVELCTGVEDLHVDFTIFKPTAVIKMCQAIGVSGIRHLELPDATTTFWRGTIKFSNFLLSHRLWRHCKYPMIIYGTGTLSSCAKHSKYARTPSTGLFNASESVNFRTRFGACKTSLFRLHVG